jgi:hypothetical protein
MLRPVKVAWKPETEMLPSTALCDGSSSYHGSFCGAHGAEGWLFGDFDARWLR